MRLEVQVSDWICRFIAPDQWDETLEGPTPDAFRASNRELSMYHVQKVFDMGDKLVDLCIESLSGYGEAHLQAGQCVELGEGISDPFSPAVYWRSDKVKKPWKEWKHAHIQIESEGGHSSFPQTYRVLLARNARCPRLPG